MTTERSSAIGQTTGALPSPPLRPADLHRLAAALVDLHGAIAGTRYPLALPGADTAASARDATVAELRDYLIPRIRRLDAPPLVVLGGSTGVGKSTLVNSLVRAPVSPAGVLRPTTRTPVLVHHPADEPWFTTAGLLPGLATYRPGDRDDQLEELVIATAPHLPPGIALLDAPDIDSVIESNRALASRLLAAADLWLFVTTAARYADAVPWELLRAARNRSTATALVLNRVPMGAEAEISASLSSLMITNDLIDVPLFVIEESHRDGQGLLRPDVVASVFDWLTTLAGSDTTRQAVVRQTVGGAIDLLEPTATALATAANEQVEAGRQLAAVAEEVYSAAEFDVLWAIRDGSLVKGELRARLHRLTSSRDLLWIVPTRLGRVPGRIAWLRGHSAWLRHRAGWSRDRVAWSRDRTAVLVGRGGRISGVRHALETSLTALLGNMAIVAAQRTDEAWQATPAGKGLLANRPQHPYQTALGQVRAVIDQWGRAVRDMVHATAEDQWDERRIGAHSISVAGTLACVLACAGTPDETGPAAVATAVLSAVFGERAASELVIMARNDLLGRVQVFRVEQLARHNRNLAEANADETAGERLRALARETTIARLCAGLPAARTAPATLPTTGAIMPLPRSGGMPPIGETT
ncbi:MAG: ABC transporter [Micromonosporaceae bacterium]|nr:ABC transporter [Micromonosporaceae bacterium]